MKSQLNLAIVVATLATAAFAQTGTPGIAQFDQFMANTLSTYGVPGGTLTLIRNGKIILARGYGLADQEANLPMQPDTLLRIASLSKTITAVAVLHMVETGELTLDEPAFARLPDLQSPDGTDKDPRLSMITIRQLLTHTAGWDASKSGFDPTGSQDHISASLGVFSPLSANNMVRYMRGQLLDNDPGLYYAYSNFGYDVLGRIIERVSGMSYEQYVRTNVFAPMGITTARIGITLPEGQRPGEAKYYANQKGHSIFPDVSPSFVSVAYGGGWYMEGFDADGGWMISAVDYAKFISAIDGQRGNAFLKPATVATMTARPDARNWDGQDNWYACGLAVQPTAKGQIWWNDGAIDGTFTRFTRTDDGLVMVAFFNSRSNPPGRESALQGAVDAGLDKAAAEVTAWPGTDYTSLFPDADPVQSAKLPALNTADGAVNGATFDRGLVSGSWATLFGVNLSQTTRSWTDSDFNGQTLPTTLDGVSVKIAGQPAAVAYISPTQLNVQVPGDLAPGWVTVEVVNNGVSTGNILGWVTRHAPGAFTYVQDGARFASATFPDGALVSPQRPARPGDVISLWATGIDATTAGVLLKGHTITGVEVHLGGQPAAVQYSALVGPGLFQINAVVPAIPAGSQPVTVSIEGILSPDGVAVPIASN